MNVSDGIAEKSYHFSLRIINIYNDLVKEKREFILSKQLLRSATSIGANIAEASGGYSKRDFLHKMTISFKEAKETRYWISLLQDTGYIPIKAGSELLSQINEIIKMLTAIILTMKRNLGII